MLKSALQERDRLEGSVEELLGGRAAVTGESNQFYRLSHHLIIL